MRPFYALLAVCAGTAQVAWSQTNAPATAPAPLEAPTVATPGGTNVTGAATGGATANTDATHPGITAPVVIAKTQNDAQGPTAAAGQNNSAGQTAGQPPVLLAKDGGPNGRNRDQDREERRLQFESRLRDMLSGYGITSSDTQDAILAYLAQEEAGRAPLRDATRRLLIGLRRDAPPERMRELLNNYKSALAADKTRRATAQSALNAKIGYALDPRLESLLWISGMLGDGQGSAMPFSLGRGPNNGGRDGGRDGGNNGGRDGGNNGTRDGGRGGDPDAPPPAPRANMRAQSYTGSQRGTVLGTVEKKEESWIDVRDENGKVERYYPIYKAELKALDPRGLGLIAQTNIGQRVRVDWSWQQKRRITGLEVLVNEATPPITGPGAEIARAIPQ